MKILLTRNTTGYFEILPLKEDGLADYARGKIVALERFPDVAIDFGWDGMGANSAELLRTELPYVARERRAAGDYLNGVIVSEGRNIIDDPGYFTDPPTCQTDP